MLLSFELVEKVNDPVTHAGLYQSDSLIPGTYVPNMSAADRNKWKGKVVGGADPRVEIRKGMPNGTLLLIVVRCGPMTVTVSANGKLPFNQVEWHELPVVVQEAIDILQRTT